MTDPRLISLRTDLQKALELELFTLPPYLSALYSIPEGSNSEAARILQGVVLEEMLHIALVANVLNAVGGSPQISGLARKNYPSRIPHVDLPLSIPLQKFSERAIEAFMKVEAPEQPNSWVKAAKHGGVHSIGHFYDLLINNLIATTLALGEAAVFCGKPDRQLQGEYYYGGGGGLQPVHTLSDAKDVITQIAQQGEGRRQSNLTGDTERFGQPKDVAHFYRFKQIVKGRYYDRDDDVDEPSGPPLAVDWSTVYPMQDNPQPGTKLPAQSQALSAAFEATYAELLDCLHRAFNGEADAMRLAVPVMYRMRHEAIALMRVPLSRTTTLGAPMWFVQSV
jgi:hypothetical protein